MSLPSQTDLQQRVQTANQTLVDLQIAHDRFLSELEKIKTSEKELLVQARDFLDKSKVYQVLQHINTLK